MNWVNRLLAVVNTFTGRPTPTDKSAAFLVSAAAVNANFQASALAVAFCQALGTECADNTSTAILCKLKPPAGRVAPGDRLTIIEDRPTLRTWCKVATGTAAVPLVEFADADLQDSALAGTADYDTIKADLILLQVAPLNKAAWPKQAILLGGAHGLTGSDIPWKLGETDTVDDKLTAAVGPAGADTNFQYNDGGNMAGAANAVYSKVRGSVAVGVGNVLTGINSVAIGSGNTVGGADSLAAGLNNETVELATFVSGQDAKSRVANGRAYAGGKITAVGDNQKCGVEAGLATTDVNPHVLYALPLRSGVAYTVWGKVTARTAAGVVCGWKFEGVCENTGGVSRDVAVFAIAAVGADAGSAAWGLAVATNVGADTLGVTVQNPGGVTVNWGMTMEWEEVTL